MSHISEGESTSTPDIVLHARKVPSPEPAADHHFRSHAEHQGS